jgi:CDP-ribitol ribitolphosphotransferase / teichoic acid ribitol-phosphate polymerase
LKNIKYKLFAYFFNFFRIYRIKNNSISLLIKHETHFKGNLKYIYDELRKNTDFEINLIYTEYDVDKNSFKAILSSLLHILKLFIYNTYQLARSDYIILNDNFLPVAYMNINPKTTVIQLWHATGAFKKFGLSSETDPNVVEILKKISKKLDYVIVSSKNVVPYYAEAFGVSKQKVLALGIPRTDFYFKNNNDNVRNNLRKDFDVRYPTAKNKKIVLYAPTFRDDPVKDGNILKNFDVQLFNQQLLGYCLLVRFHPQINNNLISNNGYVDVTDYPDEKELLLIADILITDYSSIMIEFALLNKPMIFYPYDYNYYVNDERDFYIDYRTMVPGPIAEDIDGIVKIIKYKQYNIDIDKFLNGHFDHFDGLSTQRVVDLIYKIRDGKV